MALLALTNGGYAAVDESDLDLLQQHRWFSVVRKRKLYAAAWIKGKQILMHRFLMSANPGQLIDHIDRTGLNNQRANLRFATYSMNAHNRSKSPGKTSRFKGVSLDRRLKKWKAVIRRGSRHFYLGCFDTPRKAAAKYNRVARRLFGPHAHLNELPRP